MFICCMHTYWQSADKYLSNLKASILKVSNRFRCSIMHMTCSKRRLFAFWKMFEMTTLFSQLKALTIFHVSVHFFQNVYVNTCTCQFDFSLQIWNGLRGLQHTVWFRYPRRSRQRASNPAIEEEMKLGQVSPAYSWDTSGPITDKQELRRADEPICWKMLSAGCSRSFGHAFYWRCVFKSLLSSCCSRRSKAQLLFWYRAPNHNRGPCVWTTMNFIWAFRTPYQTVLLVDKCSLQKFTPIWNYHSFEESRIIFRLISTMSRKSNPILLVQITDFFMHL